VIVHDVGDARFSCRVAGVAYRDDRVLLQRVAGLDFWFLPGGRVEMLESATQALSREIHEELGVLPSVERLLWIVENFFLLDGRRYHELGLYFAIGLPPTLPTEGEFDAHDPYQRLIMRWIPLSEVERLPVQPAFLRTTLGAPPPVPQHIVHHDAC
jgi:ADP-ribose pyrophosphatase YjhB (NUDIX family)